MLCDPGATNAGPLVNTNFALKASGGGVYLFDAPANGGSLLSAITYGLQAADLSIGRVPDGSTNWFLCGPTPAAANRTVTSLGDPAEPEGQRVDGRSRARATTTGSSSTTRTRSRWRWAGST